MTIYTFIEEKEVADSLVILWQRPPRPHLRLLHRAGDPRHPRQRDPEADPRPGHLPAPRAHRQLPAVPHPDRSHRPHPRHHQLVCAVSQLDLNIIFNIFSKSLLLDLSDFGSSRRKTGRSW